MESMWVFFFFQHDKKFSVENMNMSNTSTDGSVITPAYVVVSHTHAGYAFGALQLITLITGEVHCRPTSADQEDIKTQISVNISAYLLIMTGKMVKCPMNTKSTMHYECIFIILCSTYDIINN